MTERFGSYVPLRKGPVAQGWVDNFAVVVALFIFIEVERHSAAMLPVPDPLSSPRFSPGQIVVTSHALGTLCRSDILMGLKRHLQGDWGEVCDEDRRANDAALVEGHRLLSSYKSSQGIPFWIITEWDRSITTVLLPEDY